MLYSARTGRWSGKSQRPSDVGPNPYDPSSPGFAERNRQQVIDLPGGLQRVDLGAPIVSHPSQEVPPADPIDTRLSELLPVPGPAPAKIERPKPRPRLPEAAGRFSLSPTLD